MNSLRELQLAELKILKAVASVCDDLGITYFMNSGTLLGAVRHGGFIPWDDDVDICMPFEDYIVFLKLGQEALGEEFFVQNMETEPNFHFSYTKVRLNGTTCLDSYRKTWDIHHGVSIDVFPIVQLSGRRDFKWTHRLLTVCNFLQMDNFLDNNLEDSRKELGSVFVSLLKGFYFVVPRHVRIKLHRKILWRVLSKKKEPCRSVLWGNITTFYPVNVFAETTKLQFEDAFLSAPAAWDEYLTYTYGDYMVLPPVEKRRAHTIDIVDLEHDYRELLKHSVDEMLPLSADTEINT